MNCTGDGRHTAPRPSRATVGGSRARVARKRPRRTRERRRWRAIDRGRASCVRRRFGFVFSPRGEIGALFGRRASSWRRRRRFRTRCERRSRSWSACASRRVASRRVASRSFVRCAGARGETGTRTAEAAAERRGSGRKETKATDERDRWFERRVGMDFNA